MRPDAVEASPEARRREVRAAASLTRRASLNGIAALLDYGARIGVGLVVTPVLVGGLGRSLFGAWEMLSRLTGYVTAVDGRSPQALRAVVAWRQAQGDEATQRRYVGAALVVWLLFLPAVLGAGAVLAWLAPAATDAAPAERGAVRATAAWLVAGFALLGLATIPEAVLRGMNLGYRRMGVQAGIVVAGGALTIAAVHGGLGLPGVAAAQAAVALLTGACFLVVVKRNVPWFGVARPTRAEVRPLLALSAWHGLGDVVAKLLLASDVIILGLFTSTETVAVYVLTAYAARVAVGIHEMAVTSAMPGLGGLVGAGESARAAAARAELLAFTFVFALTAAGAIALWNRAFLALWIGPGHYAGGWANLLIALLAVQTALIRADAYLLDAMLEPRRRVQVALGAAVTSLSLAALLTPAFGVPGLCLGMLAGRLVQSIGYPRAVGARLAPAAPGRVRGVARALERPALASAAVLGACAWLGERLPAAGWAAWAAGTAASVPVLAAAAAFAGLPGHARARLARRLRLLPQVLARRAA